MPPFFVVVSKDGHINSFSPYTCMLLSTSGSGVHFLCSRIWPGLELLHPLACGRTNITPVLGLDVRRRSHMRGTQRSTNAPNCEHSLLGPSSPVQWGKPLEWPWPRPCGPDHSTEPNQPQIGLINTADVLSLQALGYLVKKQ